MDYIAKINRQLHKQFGGRYTVRPEREHLVLEGESGDWQEIVAAGHLAAKGNAAKGNRSRGKATGGKATKGCLVNDVRCTGPEQPPMRVPGLRDSALEGAAPDVLVIGGGVVGCAIARELTRWRLDVLLAEKENDVALHASSRNDGMVHPGIDLREHTLKYKYNMLGNEMYGRACEELQVPFKREGQYLCFPGWISASALRVAALYWKRLDVPCRVLNQKELFRVLPNLEPGLGGALFFPTGGCVCPYNLTIAYAENAVMNGARISLNTAVLGMDVEDGRITAVRTNRGTIHPRIIINAAGVFAEDIAAMAGDRFFSIHPRRGTNSILDKKAGDIARYNVSSIRISHITGSHTKGGGIVRTVHDNLLLGPDAVEFPEKENFATFRNSIETVLGRQQQTIAQLNQNQIITYFTGVRAPTFEEDFVVGPGLYTQNILHAAGIQSPGLTAAPALGVELARMAVDALGAIGLPVEENAAFDPVRPAIPETAVLSEDERAALIRESPDYGVILCRCEQVSRGEILDALRRPLPCDSIDGVKRRVRAGMGRCQGGFCGPLVAQVIAQELGIPLEQVRKGGESSEVLCGCMKEMKEGGA